VQGRNHVLSLEAAPMAQAADWMEFYRRFWTDRLAALEKFVTTDSTTTSDKENTE
jgi:hypothetical protein